MEPLHQEKHFKHALWFWLKFENFWVKIKRKERNKKWYHTSPHKNTVANHHLFPKPTNHDAGVISFQEVGEVT